MPANWAAKFIGYNMLIDGIDQMIDVQLDDSAVYVVAPGVEYAVYQEYGTRYHEPQPYMRPAAEEAQGRIGEIVADAQSLEVGVEKTAKFIEKRAKELAPVDTGALRASITTERVR